MPLFTKCDWSCSSVPLSTVERVKRVSVSVVVPWRTSTTLTRILAGLDADDGVAVAPCGPVPLAVPVAVRVVAAEVQVHKCERLHQVLRLSDANPLLRA